VLVGVAFLITFVFLANMSIFLKNMGFPERFLFDFASYSSCLFFFFFFLSYFSCFFFDFR